MGDDILGMPTASMSSRRQKIIEAIRQHFRALGQSPSHREIAAATGVQRQHVGAWLDILERDGLLTYERGVPRSIRLIDRSACLSDTEIEMACALRGWTIVKPPIALAAAYPVSTDVPDYGLPLLEKMRDILLG